jgi:hypothetical protein
VGEHRKASAKPIPADELAMRFFGLDDLYELINELVD